MEPDVDEFLTPSVVSGMVADLLADNMASAKVGRQVVENAVDYVPTDDAAALRAVGRYAD